MKSEKNKRGELLFSVTAKDCRWQYMAASSKGGQRANKKETKVRCEHIASGAVGQCKDHREQRKNKVEAFRRMTDDKRFKAWHRLEVAKHLGTLRDIERRVEKSLRQIRVEVIHNGEWIDEGDANNK